jgi:hypothetical protein
MAVPKFQFQAQPIRHLSRPQPPIFGPHLAPAESPDAAEERWLAD